MLPVIELGPFVIPAAPMVYLITIWLLLSLMEHAAPFVGLTRQHGYTITVVFITAGVAAAKAAFIFLHWGEFGSLLAFVWPIHAGYQWGWGILTAIFAAAIYTRHYQLPLWPLFDLSAGGLIFITAMLVFADFLAGPGYGKAAAVWWGIEHLGVTRHPVQLYLIAGWTAVLIRWYMLLQQDERAGIVGSIALAGMGIAGLIGDAFYANTPLTDSGYHWYQISFWLLLLVALLLLRWRSFTPVREMAHSV